MIPFALALLLFSSVYADQVSTLNATQQLANSTVANVTAYVSLVNQSAYLVFWPNLANAYSNLSAARLYIQSSPVSAIVDADKARYAAGLAYNTTVGCANFITAPNSTPGCNNKKFSFAALLLLTAIMTVVLINLMKPIDKKKLARYKKFSD